MQSSPPRRPRLAQASLEKLSAPSSVGGSLILVFVLIWAAVLIGSGFSRFVRPAKVQLMGAKSSYPHRFTQVPSVPTGSFKYGGSTAWAPIRLVVDSSIQAERLEFQLRYVEPRDYPSSSSQGIRMLLSGQLSFAQSARPLMSAEYEAAKRQGITLKQIPVAIDGVALAVHPRLNLPGLTLNQLQLIYSGQVKNWKQVGGPDLEVLPFWRFQNATHLMDFPVGGLYSRPTKMMNFEAVPTTTEALRRLAGSPGGLYYASASVLVPQCSVKLLPLGRQPGRFVAPYVGPQGSVGECPNPRPRINLSALQTGQYPITRYLYVIVKENGQVEQQAGEAYVNFLLTRQGQALLSQAGFVSLR
ncbi:Phosphate-binding protein PstS [Acaryochloris thomasi RCC1774]|uniref:Phosphate-binding protein PstS n=1 Tax=Acaryochloris thomasi RCC1774 TaxID=1764569 RepID=A0A2W1JQ03_9CYAN|nr:substrate-binding domain-containing protein [Acaryochloris thomasi]PZD73495.1 Phosphate-binding protein PstS [Acaryochloris thomasi RCC1774]